MIKVRAEKPEDLEAIRQVNVAAFGRDGEANLVDRLRSIASTFSFVAVKSGQIVGHIFFSPVAIDGECRDDLLILGLAPVAVLPDYQRQGIGTAMIRHGLNECAQLGSKAVVVLGSPEYYRRFGFTSAKERGLTCQYKVPDEAFMVLELEQGALKDCVGMVRYRSEFDALE